MISAVRLTAMSHHRARALHDHRKRRIRKKWRKVLVMDPCAVAAQDTAEVVQSLQRLVEVGVVFTPQGGRRIVRALNKLGHTLRAPRA